MNMDWKELSVLIVLVAIVAIFAVRVIDRLDDISSRMSIAEQDIRLHGSYIRSINSRLHDNAKKSE